MFLSLIVVWGLFYSAGCSEGMPDDEAIEYDEIKELIAEDRPNKVKGSCNVIADSSTCLDFIGSVWSEERMKLSCEGTGVFSFDSCPYSELGGCRMTGGTVTESISWSYGYGGQPISAEEASYQAQACNALPGGFWVMPDQVYLQEIQ